MYIVIRLYLIDLITCNMNLLSIATCSLIIISQACVFPLSIKSFISLKICRKYVFNSIDVAVLICPVLLAKSLIKILAASRIPVIYIYIYI